MPVHRQLRTGTSAGMLVLAVALGGCTAEPQPATQPQPGPSVIVPGEPGEPAVTMPAERAARLNKPVRPTAADISYMQQMVTHHGQAIVMTDLADTRAAGKDVRGIAARIGDSQQPEMDAMNGWLRRHDLPVGRAGHGGHGGSGHGAHGGGHGAGHQGHGGGHGAGGAQRIQMSGMATDAELDGLRRADGAGFDRQFLRLMIAHHQGAVRMAQDLLGMRSADPIVQQLAQDVIATQNDEIGRMRGMQAG